MRQIARRVANLGGRYCVYPNECNLFVTYDYIKADGTLKNCTRLARVKEFVNKGKSVEICSFAEFLAWIGTTEEELDRLATVVEPTPAPEAAEPADAIERESVESEEAEEIEDPADLEQIPAVNA